MNVLSLFDGMSCGQIALNRAGIEYENYFASEIDKYAIHVTMANYLDTIQLGDVRHVDGSKLPKIDLVLGGSPCQGFSFAGRQLNFNDERSKLFFEYVRLLEECKPKYFLLENVIMNEQSNDIISSTLGELYPDCVTQARLFEAGRLEPVMINSALVSAQNRRRLYWTNIPGITQPKDKGLSMDDILEYDVSVPRHKYNPDRMYDAVIIGNCHPSGMGINGNVFDIRYKAPTVTTNKGEGSKIGTMSSCRTLKPIECERLQTVPDNYTNHVSNTQRYKMLGNGWTIDVIVHILNNIREYK